MQGREEAVARAQTIVEQRRRIVGAMKLIHLIETRKQKAVKKDGR